MTRERFVVRINCWTYNHVNYITDAMNGFVIQETNFPFVCTIVDDASTDGEQEVIRQYLQEHFDLEDKSVVRNEETDDYVLTFAQHKTNKNCYFAVLYLKYNHYSIKKSKLTYLEKWRDVKYFATCEGDDYWIHSHKLQMQYEVLEAHFDYMMVCCRTKQYSIRKETFIEDNACYESSRLAIPEDVIIKGGLFISTCSYMFRSAVLDNYPSYCKNCHVGDYPLQIMCAMKGKIYYLNEPMAVYRVENPNSWVGKQKENVLSEKRLYGIMSEIRMLQGLKKDCPNFGSSFSGRIEYFILHNLPDKRNDMRGYLLYCKTFINEMCQFDFKTKMRVLMPYYLPQVYKFYSMIKK